MERINRWPLWLVTAVGAMMLLPAVFMGMDVCDAGFYLTFYDNIFSAPETVEYNFMYYLSGLIGGAVSAFVPGGGMLWMRIFGAGLLLCSVAMVCRAYRNLEPPEVTAVGVLCVVLGYVTSPLTLSYDIVSLLLLTGGSVALLKGTTGNRPWALALAGALYGLNLFARVPNVLDALFLLLIPLCGERGRCWRGMWMFAAGYAVAVVLMVGWMALTGDLDVFVENIRTLCSVSTDGEASHGLTSLIWAQIEYYILLAKVLVKIAVLAVWCMCLRTFVRRRWLQVVLVLPALFYFCYLVETTTAVLLLGAVSLPAMGVISLRRDREVLTVAARIALLGALLFPCGSDGGGSNIGAVLYLLCAPLALGWWMRLRLIGRGRTYTLPHNSVRWGAGLYGGYLVWRIWSGGLYFDSTPLYDMTATVNSARARCILTSPNRADALNALLPELEKYVRPGDTLFAYGSIPLANYLTSTRPYIGCSWPEQLSAAQLDARLTAAAREELPVVCVQRFATIGSTWGTPSESFVRGEEAISTNTYHNAAKWVVMERFLADGGYRRVGGTPMFDIYLPR